jgi:hypothetical protein
VDGSTDLAEGASVFGKYVAPGLSHDLRKYEIISNNLSAVMRESSSKVRCTH